MRPPGYTEIRSTIRRSAEEDLADALSQLGVLGVQVEPREEERVEVSVWVSAGKGGLELEIQKILDALGSDEVQRTHHESQDWSAEWRRRLTAFEVGRRWWIDPHPDTTETPPEGRLQLAVEPRAAFGSGTHESTRLMLMDMEELDFGGQSVLDIGTGSGVLSVAAERLGAATVVALDIDPLAAWEARATALRQPWRCRLSVVAGPVGCLGRVLFDVVLCNMIIAEFEPFLPELRNWLAPGGVVVLSGILECERAAVTSLLADSGLRAVGQRRLGDWISVRAERDRTR
ncbi:MAG: 50S ribosomal protein L11 methyltransferase [Thermoanaerobaculales bacterium]|jgi:ribosomal protein L11 methyltransferase|nr:50S ribosomal protein L11 methyltransferase [Thermoanaerobaculales bacterium]